MLKCKLSTPVIIHTEVTWSLLNNSEDTSKIIVLPVQSAMSTQNFIVRALLFSQCARVGI